MRIDAVGLTAFVRDIFIREGCSEGEAERIGRFLVAANLTGHDSHGVIRVPRYVSWLREGELVADQTPEIALDGGAFALVDAKYGFGQTAAPFATDLGIARAKEHGVSVIALRHAGHIGRIGEWAERAAAAGLVSTHYVNVAGSLLVAPFGSVERRFSTNPFAAGFPVPGASPIILDFATSAVAEGKVLVASQGGKPLPGDVLIEPDGRLSADPATLYGPLVGLDRDNQKGVGAIRAFGEHKGSGLSLMCELLAGALTGSGTAGPGPRRVCNGMLSLYLTPEAFGARDDIAAEARAYLDFFKTARPTPGGEVLLPGEPERRMRSLRGAEGVPLPEPVWATLLAAGRSHGLDGNAYRA
jgi:uncharacterized oxidoreductase